MKIILLVEKNHQLLVLEDAWGEYHFPKGEKLEKETINQSIERVLMEETGLNEKKVLQEVPSAKKDDLKIFVIQAHDPEDLMAKGYKGYGWAEPSEIFGYPIKEDLREVLDLYLKFRLS